MPFFWLTISIDSVIAINGLGPILAKNHAMKTWTSEKSKRGDAWKNNDILIKRFP